MESAVFHEVGELELTMELMHPPGSDQPSYAVWIHGGALMFGSRHHIPQWLSETCLGHDIGLASIEYRLAPTTTLPAIVDDVERAIAWLAEDRAPSRLAVVGESAGGYLALVAGFRATPRPDAIVSLWGYGDLLGEWYTRPSPHPVHREIEMSEEQARSQVDGPEVADERDRPGNPYAFYLFCRQRGIWPSEVSGWDPVTESGRFEPYMPIANVAATFPPTLLVHGTEDTDVPHTEGEKMASLLQEVGVEHELLSVEGAEHGLDRASAGEVDAVYETVSRFLVDRLVSPG